MNTEVIPNAKEVLIRFIANMRQGLQEALLALRLALGQDVLTVFELAKLIRYRRRVIMKPLRQRKKILETGHVVIHAVIAYDGEGMVIGAGRTIIQKGNEFSVTFVLGKGIGHTNIVGGGDVLPPCFYLEFCEGKADVVPFLTTH